MNIVIDLDGVIAREKEGWDYTNRIPLPKAVDSIIALKSQGHIIIIYSSRFVEDYDVTIAWLIRYKIPFDRLILGKPRGDIYIDDRGFFFTDWSEALEEISAISN